MSFTRDSLSKSGFALRISCGISSVLCKNNVYKITYAYTLPVLSSLIKSLLTFHFIHSIQSSAYISFVLHIGHSDETRPIILKKERTPCISAKEGKKGEDRVYLWKKNSKERKDVRKPRMKEEMC